MRCGSSRLKKSTLFEMDILAGSAMAVQTRISAPGRLPLGGCQRRLTRALDERPRHFRLLGI